MENPEFEIQEVINTDDPLKVDVKKFSSPEELGKHLTKTLQYIGEIDVAINIFSDNTLQASDAHLKNIFDTLSKYRDMLSKISEKLLDDEIKPLHCKAFFLVFYNIGRVCHVILSKETIKILSASINHRDYYTDFYTHYMLLMQCFEEGVLSHLVVDNLIKDPRLREYYRKSQYMICDATLNLGIARKTIRKNLDYLTAIEITNLINHLVSFTNIITYNPSIEPLVAGLLERIEKTLNHDVLSRIANQVSDEALNCFKEGSQYDLIRFRTCKGEDKKEEDLAELAREIEGCSSAPSNPKKQSSRRRPAKRSKGKAGQNKREEAKTDNHKNGRSKPSKNRRKKKIVPSYLRGMKVLEGEQSAIKSKGSEDEFSGEEVFFADSKDFLTRLKDAVKKFNGGESIMAKQCVTDKAKAGESTSRFNAKEASKFLQKQYDEALTKAREDDPDFVIYKTVNSKQ